MIQENTCAKNLTTHISYEIAVQFLHAADTCDTCVLFRCEHQTPEFDRTYGIDAKVTLKKKRGTHVQYSVKNANGVCPDSNIL